MNYLMLPLTDLNLSSRKPAKEKMKADFTEANPSASDASFFER